MEVAVPNILNIFRRAATPSSSSEDSLSPGSALLSELDRCTRQDSRSSEYVVGDARDSLPVNGDGLLNVYGPKGKPVLPLDASRMSQHAVLMASPDGDNDLSTVVNACIHNGIGQVVDLTNDQGVTAALFSGKAPWTESHGSSRQVEVKPLTPRSATKDPDVFGLDASEARLDLRAGDGAHSASQEVSWIRLPGVPKNRLPEALLGMCRRLMHSGQEETSVAFMDRHGGSLAATFAAANAIFRGHVRQPLTVGEVADVVTTICKHQRMTRSYDLYKGRPDLLDALQEFTQLLIQQGSRLPTQLSSAFAPGRLRADDLAEFRAASGDPQDVPKLSDQTGPLPRRSAMKQPKSIYATTPEPRNMGPRQPDVRFDSRVKASHFELFQEAASTDRIGDQERLDDNGEKPKSRSLRQELAQVNEDLKKGGVSSKDREVLAQWRDYLEQQIGDRANHLAEFDKADEHSAAEGGNA